MPILLPAPSAPGATAPLATVGKVPPTRLYCTDSPGDGAEPGLLTGRLVASWPSTKARPELSGMVMAGPDPVLNVPLVHRSQLRMPGTVPLSTEVAVPSVR